MTPSQTHKPMILLAALLLAVSMTTAMLAVLSGKQIVQAASVGGTVINSDIITHTTWTAAGSPYIVVSSIEVQPGITLTVDPGVVVQVEDNEAIWLLNSSLVAIGTTVNPITFTSVAGVGAGDWYGLGVGDGFAHLAHVNFNNAEKLSVSGNGRLILDETLIQNNNQGLVFNGGSVPGNGYILSQNSFFQNNAGYPIEIDIGVLHQLEITNTSFINNTPNRIHIDDTSDFLVDDVVLTSHAGLEGYEAYNGDFIIPDGITLTMQPGTQFMKEYMYGAIIVHGHLQAIGTPNQPITFTSAPNTGPGEWDGIGFAGGSSRLNHVVIRYGNHSSIAWLDPDTEILIENSIYRDFADHPLTIHPQYLHQVHITNTQFINNAPNRIEISSYSSNNMELAGDVVLVPLPGLEGYEIANDDGEFRIPTGITLTIQPGVAILTNEQTEISIKGHLQAVGTVTKPITFTSALNSGANEWYGLFFSEGSSHLEHTVIRYAEVGACAFDWLSSTSTYLMIQNSSIYSNVMGICIQSLVQGSQVFIEDSTIRNNVDYAVVAYVDGLSGLYLTNVSFQDNGYDRIFIETYGTNESLTDNAIFAPQPGLEGYELSNLMIVPTTVTLTLDPGVIMLMDEGAEINVLGHLQAIGTPNSPITFTTPDLQPHNLTELQLVGGDSHVSHAIFQYIDQVGIGYLEPNAEIVIENSVFQNMPQEPLGITAENLHQAQLTNLAFINNASNRIMIWGEGVGTIVDDVVLKAHEGLEGYVYIENFPNGAESLIVSDSVTLTVESDVSLFFPENRSIQVNGRLHTLGTPTQPITITSAANTGPGEWDGLLFEGGEGDLQYTTVRYGHVNIAVINDTAVVTLTHTQVVSGITGLAVDDGSVTAVCSTFSQNQNDGIHIFNGNNPNVTIFSSSINDNGGAGLNNQNGLLVDARYNWWGDASGPGGIGPGNGDEISGTVSYEPWLTEPACVLQIPTLLLSAEVMTVTEGIDTAVLTFTLNIAPEITVTVDYETVGDTAVPHSDYLPISGTLTFAPGSTIQVVSIPLLDDDLVESNEIFNLVLLSPMNLILAGDTVTIVIQDDDTEVTETAVIYLPFITLP